MPAGFGRDVSLDITNLDQFINTSIPDDISFQLISRATFWVWNKAKAAAVLGQNPQYDYMFNVSSSTHEGPVCVLMSLIYV